MKSLRVFALAGAFAIGMVAISPPASAQTSRLGGFGLVVSDADVSRMLGLATKVIERLRKAFGLTNFEITQLRPQSLSSHLLSDNKLSPERLPGLLS